MNRPTVFIGSSTEGLHIAEAVKVLLNRHAKVTIWNEGVFELGKGYMESLSDALNNFDFAILVLTADDLTRSREKESISPRDNVLFELGLFTGGLGRDRCFFVFDSTQNIKLPTDLMGITAATYTPHESGNLQTTLGAPCAQIKKVIASLGPRPRLLSTKQPEVQADPANTSVNSVKSPWYRGLLSRWILIVLSGLFGTLLGLLFASTLTDLSRPSGRNTVNINPPTANPSATPYSSDKKEEDIVYLLGSGTVYRYLESTKLFEDRKYIQVLEGPTGAGVSLFKNGYDPRVIAMAAEKFSFKELKQYENQEAYIYEIYLRDEAFQVLFAAGGARSDARTRTDLDNFFLTAEGLTFKKLREKWVQGEYDIYIGSENSGTRRQWGRYLFGGEDKEDYPKGKTHEWDIRFTQITKWETHSLPRIHLGGEVVNKSQEENILKSGHENIVYHSLTMFDEHDPKKKVKRGLFLYGHVDTSKVYEDRNRNIKGYYLPRPVVELLKHVFAFTDGKDLLPKPCLDAQRKYFHIGPYEGQVEGEIEGWVSQFPPSGEKFYRPGPCEGQTEERGKT